jgi:hypothetical protein
VMKAERVFPFGRAWEPLRRRGCAPRLLDRAGRDVVAVLVTAA